MTNAASTENAVTPAIRQASSLRVAEVLLIVVVYFIAVGDPPPHVNESHYLCRIKHFWNPSWCAGDLFLESTDTQVAFIWLFGWLTRWLSLAATAWIGRFVTWTLLAWSWQRLSWRLVPRPLAAVLSAALFVTLNTYGQLAGEWVVGGVEAKCIAYAFVLLALRELVDGRWNRLWLVIGAATAFHPLVGGWSGLVCGGIWLLEKGDRSIFGRRRTRFSPGIKNGPVPFFGLIVGGLLGMVGIAPALSLTWNEPAELVSEASRIYVFERLPHHLALLTLPEREIALRFVSHAGLLALLWAISRAMRTMRATGSASVSVARSAKNNRSLAEPVAPDVLGRITRFAWGAALIAGVGLAIEVVLWNQPLVAAKFLRYYWFRLTDFAAPTAVALNLTALIAAGFQRRRGWAPWTLAAALALNGICLSVAAWPRCESLLIGRIPRSPADVKVLDYPAWVEVCDWVAANTPPDALFLTPRLNLTFKWRTGRPEVANRKDIPQDARSIVEWYRRLKDIYYTKEGGIEEPLDSIGVLGTERVRELAKKYHARFVLMDRGQLLSLPIAFWNEEYVVYRIEDRTPGDRR